MRGSKPLIIINKNIFIVFNYAILIIILIFKNTLF